MFHILFLTVIFSSSNVVTSLQSPLIDSQWKLNLDVGLQPGTWMPKRFPGWAESGARLGLDISIQFTDQPSSTVETLVGPKSDTFQLKLCNSSSKFVSEFGEQNVEFSDIGGWCIQRPTGDVRNAAGSFVKPEGLLRFWIDCKSGAKRRDVEIFPDTRIFFTTGVWDDQSLVSIQEKEYKKALSEIESIAEKTRKIRQEAKEKEKKNIVEDVITFRQMVQDSKDYDMLKARIQRLEKELPPPKSPTTSDGLVKIAPTGSLVIKGNKIPDWLPGSEYLILGTFSALAIEKE